ncbi:MAG: GNAT family N-acetyltransferase [Acidimicrobiia bacterium]|nr:GNAT family N-acetyltransferase [Acidimicrobiia bacterium]
MSDSGAAARAAARPATPAELAELVRLHDRLSAEMSALRPVWPFVDGLAEPVEATFAEMLAAPEWTVYVGTLDDTVVGFLAWRDEAMLPQAGGDRIAAVRYIFTEPEARTVGVGEAMMAKFLEDAASRGIRRLDAHVSPGHREAKNFFESNGFKARAIVMHRDTTP